MSKLRSIESIKIPYATEGIIRTAALDDTIAPQDSVQLAVNMNFDRVGAIQTRPGVTNYADSITEQINNFGTLRNSLLPEGYDSIEQVGETNAIITTEIRKPIAVKITDTKIAVFWRGVDQDGFCRNFLVNPNTGSMTAIGTLVEFETSNFIDGKGILVGTTARALVAWRGVDFDGFVQTFDCSGDTINPLSSALEFDVVNANAISLAEINASNFICFYEGGSDAGTATVFQVNGATGAVTQPGSPLVFEATNNFRNSCAPLGDGTRFINSWTGGASGIPKAQMFSVNLTTWAITALATEINLSNASTPGPLFPIGDGSRFMSFYVASGAAAGFSARVLEANTTTYALSEIGTPVKFQDGSSGNELLGVSYGDGENFVALYTENIGFGYVQLINMNPSTYAITLTPPKLSEYDFAGSGEGSPILISPTKIFMVWSTNINAGFSAMFQTFGTLVNGRWLYAGHGDEVSNTDDQVWTVRRSGLAQVSKPRFAQYLNYIWMVNGNQRLGGDPVATSKGGAFGNDLVPVDFPRGDFIHAGFEGRVWVVDKTLGIIHYTDIVQFSPPNIYTLTYDRTVNFISNLSPQTGQSFTALYRVPRALLIFTEDSIFRIYGATSLDAYPAYNVGTFSQESIVESKTGIFFHHSSGFYQFDYGSQPVEISRRIIDFVKAIPRSAYSDVKGVYDGFDTVEWSVGSVTVEGVVFSNCVLRYTLSTQVWTVYDYTGNVITAMISYDNGESINHLIGTSAGLVGALDTGNTDFGQPFYYEFIDRWRSFTEMYCEIKALDGINVYSENAAGANLTYQIQKSGPNAWLPLLTVSEKNNSLDPNAHTEDFDVVRIRLAGNTRGVQVVVHGIEILSMINKGFNRN